MEKQHSTGPRRLVSAFYWEQHHKLQFLLWNLWSIRYYQSGCQNFLSLLQLKIGICCILTYLARASNICWSSVDSRCLYHQPEWQNANRHQHNPSRIGALICPSLKKPVAKFSYCLRINPQELRWHRRHLVLGYLPHPKRLIFRGLFKQFLSLPIE